MRSRERKALYIYMSRKIQRIGPTLFAVAQRKNKGRAESDPHLISSANGMWTCSCPAFADAGFCSHPDAVQKWLESGEPSIFYPDYAFQRPTYPQDWSKYKAARRLASAAIKPMLAALLRHADYNAPTKRAGRKGKLLIHVLFAFALRVLYKKSELEAEGEVVAAFADRYFGNERAPGNSTTTRLVRSEEAVKLLKHLIRISGLAAREFSDGRVSADGAEFNVPNRDENDPDLFPDVGEQKAAKRRRQPKIAVVETVTQSTARKRRALPATKTVKLHPLIHNRTKLIIAAIVTLGKANDGKQLPALLTEARKDHAIKVLAADKGYSSAENYQYCENHNIQALIPPKENWRADEDGPIVRRYAAKWRAIGSNMPEEYGFRNNAEGSHSAIKRIHYEDLRSRTFLAQQSELLTMVLLLNLRRLVYLYVVDGVNISWLDGRCKRMLDPVRKQLARKPNADKSPRFPGTQAA